jgi:tetratricopeptide (TPR) repeat protein
VPALAALTGTELEECGLDIEELASGHLVEGAARGRWRMHDLLRSFAMGLLSEAERRDGVSRMVEHYRAATGVATAEAFPDDHAAGQVGDHRAATQYTGSAEALAWLEAERENLVACIEIGVREGCADQAMALGALLWRFLDNGLYTTEALSIHQTAVSVARARADRSAEARALTRLGLASYRWDRHTEAAEQLREALAIARGVPDLETEGAALNGLGLVLASLGDYRGSSESFAAAVAVAREVDRPLGVAAGLDNLGRTHRLWGRFTDAVECERGALATCVSYGLRSQEGRTRANLAAALAMTGDAESALIEASSALDSAVAAHDPIGEGMARESLALVLLHTGRLAEALENLQQTTRIAVSSGAGDRTETLIATAEVLVAMGDHAEAAAHLDRAAASVPSGASSLVYLAPVHNGRGAVALAIGDPDAAVGHHTAGLAAAETLDQWFDAFRAYQGLGAAEVARGDATAAQAALAQAAALVHRMGLADLAPSSPDESSAQPGVHRR